MQIQRLQYNILSKSIVPGKVVILYGPRRVGKTTLLRRLENDTQLPFKAFTGDNASDRKNLSIGEISHIKTLVGQSELIIIDEAQKIENIGSILKIMTDYLPRVNVVASGSSSFDLAQKAEAELVGRNTNLLLYPLSFTELANHFGQIETHDNLENYLIWGSYPETVTKNDNLEKRNYLQTLVGSSLYRDILELAEIRKPKQIEDLLRLLAFQIGQEVSLPELGQNLSLNRETVVKYLDLLEKSFIIFNVRGFSRNLRKEVYKSSRYYFWDNGVRNAVIDNFNALTMRDDVGQLWENYLAVERLKKMEYAHTPTSHYFWRTYDQKEIDWIEESNGQIRGFEFKWKENKIKPAITREFQAAYPKSSVEIVNQSNYKKFIMQS